MRGITRIIKKRGMENFIGLMVECTKDSGWMDFSMEKAYILTDQEERFQENGLKDKEYEINIFSTTFD